MSSWPDTPDEVATLLGDVINEVAAAAENVKVTALGLEQAAEDWSWIPSMDEPLAAVDKLRDALAHLEKAKLSCEEAEIGLEPPGAYLED